MLLQVHDELVFEVPDAEVEATIPVVQRVMIDAPHPAVTLSRAAAGRRAGARATGTRRIEGTSDHVGRRVTAPHWIEARLARAAFDSLKEGRMGAEFDLQS